MLNVENNDNFKSKTLGENIKNIRKKSNYTQEEFSEKIGITPQFLSSVERGINGISLATTIKICRIAKCSPNVILKDIVETTSIEDKFGLLSNRDKCFIEKMIDYLLEEEKQKS